MCGARWQAPQTLLGRASASPALSGRTDRIGFARILLPLALHTSSILNTINLQTILYNRIVLMGERRTVWWEDISEDAAPLFRVWTDGQELHWAKKSWEALGKRGLTSYADQVERARVMVRLMTLAAIYRDFCELAFDEVHDPVYEQWAGDLGLGTFRVAQCVGAQFERDGVEEDNELLERALHRLMEEARAEICGKLRAEYGDNSMLLVSLWNTVEYWRPEDAPTGRGQEINSADSKVDSAMEFGTVPTRVDWKESAYSILNDEIAGNKLKAFNWIEEGMPSVH